MCALRDTRAGIPVTKSKGRNSLKIEEVEKNIHLVHGTNEGRFPFSHSVLITDKITALIDTGCGPESLKAVKESFPLQMIIYSHAHPDHCSGCGTFPKESLWGPKEHRDSTGNLQKMAARFTTPPLQSHWIAYWRESLGFQEFRASHFYDEGHLFDFGTITVKPVHVPGHCDDHYCFYLPKQRIMLTTDIDFTPFGPWYANPEADIDLFMDSIDRIRRHNIDSVISSHRGVIRNDLDRHFREFLEIFRTREEKILEFLQTPRSLEDFVEAALIYGVYPEYRGPILRFWEEQMISKHLRRLLFRNLIREKDGIFYLEKAQ